MIREDLLLQPRGDTTTSWLAAGIALTLITIATLIGNLSMITALVRVKRSPTHYPLISLVVADFLVGLVVLPIAAARELFVFHLPHTVCAFWGTMDVMCCTASILSLCALGWERWSGITAPLSRARRGEKARLLSRAVWPIACAVALPAAIIPSPRHFHPGELAKACTVNTNIGYVFFSISFSFYIPATMMLVMYGYIIRALASPPPIRVHRGRSPYVETQNEARVRTAGDGTPERNPIDHNRNITPKCSTPRRTRVKIPGTTRTVNLPTPLKSPRTMTGIMTRQRRATRIIIMLMALFFVCWAPFFIMLPVDSLCDCVNDAAWQWCTWLGYLNSALNPLVYSAGSPSVRRVIRASFTTSSSGNARTLPMCLPRPNDVE